MCDISVTYLRRIWFRTDFKLRRTEAYAWRMCCCGVTVSLTRRFSLTCNIVTAYVRRKQLRIKAPVRAALLLCM